MVGRGNVSGETEMKMVCLLKGDEVNEIDRL